MEFQLVGLITNKLLFIVQIGAKIMALIKCPECGKENVSDSAESCPECGYNIKKHFDNFEREQLRKTNTSTRKTNNKGWKITSGIISLLIGIMQGFTSYSQVEYGIDYDVAIYIDAGVANGGSALLIILAGILTFTTISKRKGLQIATIVVFVTAILYELLNWYASLITIVTMVWCLACVITNGYLMYKNTKN